MHEIKAIIFDMDGILFDTERISKMMWKKAAVEFNIEDIEDALRKCTGTSFDDAVSILHSKYGDDFPAKEFRQRCSVLIHEYIDANELPLMPYAKEILVYLKSKNYRLALASSTRTVTVHSNLKKAGLFDFFETITCGDMVSHSKPEPDIYLEACKSLSLSPEFCMAVEDSPNGVISSFKAGLKTIMIPDQIQPDENLKKYIFKILSNLDEMKKVL